MSSLDLAIVMPIYNEEANIRTVIAEWTGALGKLGINFTLFAVNDGSKDGTRGVLLDLAQAYPGQVELVDKKNAGHGLACRTGYDLAVERGAQWTLQIDSDGQCDPQYFPTFWEQRADADVIFGVRKTRDDGLARVLISQGCRLGTSLLAGMDLKDANVPYRLIRTDVLKDALSRVPNDFDMQNVALTLALKRSRALRWKYVPIHFRDRQGGTNSINIRRIMQMGFVLLTSLHKIGR